MLVSEAAALMLTHQVGPMHDTCVITSLEVREKYLGGLFRIQLVKQFQGQFPKLSPQLVIYLLTSQ